MELRKLRPSELVKLLNSTPLGPIINDKRMKKHRQDAGFLIGDVNTVDFFKYAIWLIDQRHNKKQPEMKPIEGVTDEEYADQCHREIIDRLQHPLGK